VFTGAACAGVNARIHEAPDQAIADSFVIHKFNEVDAPRVFMSISENARRGECERCPGQFHRPEAGGELIFCGHECHKVVSVV
jgi:hypothetical protein